MQGIGRTLTSLMLGTGIALGGLGCSAKQPEVQDTWSAAAQSANAAAEKTSTAASRAESAAQLAESAASRTEEAAQRVEAMAARMDAQFDKSLRK